MSTETIREARVTIIGKATICANLGEGRVLFWPDIVSDDVISLVGPDLNWASS
jgi:hypothetical protein